MLTGRENLLIFAKLYDVPRAERAARIGEALAFAGLEEAAGRLVRTYSGGMIRRLEVATALLHRPRVLFLDEPTVGLDPVARQAVWQQVRNLVAQRGMAVLLTTHHMDEADALCNRVAIMNFGTVRGIGSPPSSRPASTSKTPRSTTCSLFTPGAPLESGGQYRDVAATRRTTARTG